MPTLFRYLIRLYLAGFLKVFGLFMGLFFLVDGVEQIRRMAQLQHVDWQEIALLLMLRMPGFLVQFLPAVALLTTLTVLKRLAHQNEITAMRTCGLSIYRILIPIAFCGLLIGTGHFIFQDQVVSRTKEAADRLSLQLRNNTETEKPLISKTGYGLWLREGKTMIHAEQVSLHPEALIGVSLLYFDSDFRSLIRRVDARKGERRNKKNKQGAWVLLDGVERQFGEHPKTVSFQEYPWETRLSSEQLDRSTPAPESLSLLSLWKFSERLRQEGYDATPYRVMLHRKLADPVTSLVTILVAVPFSLRLSRAGGATTALIAGLVAGFLLFVIVDFTSALGMGGRIPPWLAAWSPTLLFGCLGMYLLMHMEEGVYHHQNRSTVKTSQTV